MQKGSPPAAAALGSVQTAQTHGDIRRPDPIRALRGTSASPRCPRLARLVGGVLAAGSCQTGPAAQAALRRRRARHDALASSSPSAVPSMASARRGGGRRASLEDLGDAVQGSDLADAWQARHFVQGAGRGGPLRLSLTSCRLRGFRPTRRWTPSGSARATGSSAKQVAGGRRELTSPGTRYKQSNAAHARVKPVHCSRPGRHVGSHTYILELLELRRP